MATFKSQAFSERGQGGGQGFPAHGRKANIATTEIPGGSPVFQVINDGDGATPFSIACQGTAAQLDALRGEVGTEGSLVFVGGTITALLSGVDSPEQVIDDVDLWRWSLAFIG